MEQKARLLFIVTAVCISLDGLMQIATSMSRLINESDMQDMQIVNALKLRTLLGLILIAFCGFGYFMVRYELSCGILFYATGMIFCIAMQVSLILYLAPEGLERTFSVFFVVMQEFAIVASLYLSKEFLRKDVAKQSIAGVKDALKDANPTKDKLF